MVGARFCVGDVDWFSNFKLDSRGQHVGWERWHGEVEAGSEERIEFVEIGNEEAMEIVEDFGRKIMWQVN